MRKQPRYLELFALEAMSRLNLVQRRSHESQEALYLAAMPDGRLASMWSYDEARVRIWDVTQRALIQETVLAHPVLPTNEGTEGHGLAVLDDGRVLSAAGDALFVWDLDRRTRTCLVTGPSNISALAVLPDQRLLVAFDDGTVDLWSHDVKTFGARARRLRHHAERVHQVDALYPDHVRGFAVFADGRTVAAYTDEGVVVVWDVNRREQIPVPPSRVSGRNLVSAIAALSEPDTLAIAYVGFPASIELWRLGGLERGPAWEFHHESSTFETLLPLPRWRLAAGSTDGSVRIWKSWNSFASIPVVDWETSIIRSLVRLADGRLATGSAQIRVWARWKLEWAFDTRHRPTSINSPRVQGRFEVTQLRMVDRETGRDVLVDEWTAALWALTFQSRVPAPLMGMDLPLLVFEYCYVLATDSDLRPPGMESTIYSDLSVVADALQAIGNPLGEFLNAWLLPTGSARQKSLVRLASLLCDSLAVQN